MRTAAFIAILVASVAMPLGANAKRVDDSLELNTAEQLVRAMNIGSLYEETMAAVMISLAAELTKNLTASDPEIHALEQRRPGTITNAAYAVMGEGVSRVAQNAKGELINEFVKVYARNFTKEELEDALRFYTSPAGKRFVLISPQLSQETIALSQRLLTPMVKGITEKAMPRIVANLKAQVQAHNNTATGTLPGTVQ